MVGVFIAVLTRMSRHTLVVAGGGLAVAAIVAFLPVASSANSDPAPASAATALDAGPPGANGALPNMLNTANPSNTPGAAPTDPAAPSSSALPASAPPTNELNGAPTEVVGQALFRSALQSTPVPTAAAARAPAAYLPSLEAALGASAWPRELWPTVERIVACESSGNTAAVGPGGYIGLMQVDPRLHGAVPADAVGQLDQAYGVYLRQGWGAWGCY